MNEKVRTAAFAMTRPDNRYQEYEKCTRCGKTVNVRSMVDGLCHACQTEREMSHDT